MTAPTECTSDQPRGQLTAREAASRLGVKVDTVYAYVSRGYLTSIRTPGRFSRFDAAEVDALQRTERRSDRSMSRPFSFPAIASRLTLMESGTFAYRGRDVARLARTARFEQVLNLLWYGRLSSDLRVVAPEMILRQVRQTLLSVPSGLNLVPLMQMSVAAAAAVTVGVTGLRRQSVTRSGLVAMACMLFAVQHAAPRPSVERSRPADTASTTASDTAGSLWKALSGDGADAELANCVNVALITLADHGLSASTVAARAAASSRTGPFDVVAAGLSSLKGSLRRKRAATVHQMIERGVHRPRDQRLSEIVVHHQNAHGMVPGFSRTYDPRVDIILAALRDVPSASEALDTAHAIKHLIDPERELQFDVFMALAVLASAGGMPRSAPAAILSIARTAGWIAHALEEYEEEPLRWMARANYTGPRRPLR